MNRKQLIEELQKSGNDESEVKTLCWSADDNYPITEVGFNSETNEIILTEDEE